MAERTEIVLDDEQRQVLERWARRPKSSQALAFRCRAVLAAADGRSSKEIAAELGCNANTVSKWRVRFAERGLDGLHDDLEAEVKLAQVLHNGAQLDVRLSEPAEDALAVSIEFFASAGV